MNSRTSEESPENVPENAALLGAADNEPKKTQTPLPKIQIAILLLLQLCEPITSMSIYPYVNQLVSELDITGGDHKKVGYYAGLIESLFFATEAMTVLQWSRASDRVGRKRILLIGLVGTTLSMLCFGFSRTFLALVVSRCLTGLLNGNIGVMKSAMGDLTDASNRAEGFALMPASWALGGTFGPMLGGLLARPHERFPSIFNTQFWRAYPYALPCIATASVVIVIFLITAAFFKEPFDRHKYQEVTEEGIELSPTEESKEFPSLSQRPVPLRHLLREPRVVLAVSNYVALAILDIAFSALFPLFCTMPVQIGGLGLSPSTIGYILAIYGCVGGTYNCFFFARIVRRFGEGRAFLLSMALFVPIFGSFPLINAVARRYGSDSFGVWAAVGLLLAMAVIMGSGYGAIFIFVTASAPNKQSLGATNGISQMAVSVSRAIGPAMASSLFSLSVEGNYLGGYAVYFFLMVLTLVALVLASRLPQKSWDDYD